ncbi:hypothetical protein EK21DRAFT_105485 [Setomelanomma holmii]|uniref:NB-ARC domain-containing protein n=1 Tax=Setomelanomma holmii TaxID=210430 RepID=A0A9P4LGD4_9PLEO|nr:hypothetical protein EK21DRAFT_105485 [Setomelanomma holmii]
MASKISFEYMNYGIQAGIINGEVKPTIYLPTERPETPPPPSIVIPFARDADFVERGTILERVRQRCAASGSRVALVGLGGVGKSQLAIEYAYRTREQSSDTWVFWVHASNHTRFEQSYRNIADRANIFKLVHNWLCDCRQSWLLVLDNADDASFLLNVPATSFKTAATPLREYLPYCERGSILVTTRNKEAALKLVEQRDIVSVEPMDIAEGIALLEKKLRVQEDSDSVAELAAALENMPLAIVQAAAYISQRTPRCSIGQYLDEFGCSDHEKTSLLDYEAGQLRRDREAKNSIIIITFFDRQGIPNLLIRNGQETSRARTNPRDEVQRNGNEGRFEDNVMALRDLYFITVAEDSETFEMHSLIQLATRKWLAANGKLETWKQQFISNLFAAFPTGEYENWPACQALFAHAKAAALQQPEAESSLVEWATLLYHAAWYAWKKGNAAEAEELAVKSMKARQNTLGREHKDTLSSMGMVGLAYEIGGQWHKAANIQRKKMEASRRVLGVDHPNTLTSMANLASTYWNQGRWDAAEELEVQVMETSKKKLGADHPDTLASMNNLAYTQRSLGRGVEAISLMRECVHLGQHRFRPNHPIFPPILDGIISLYT